MPVKLTEDRDNGVVTVDGHSIDGWIADSTCQHCNTRLVYAEHYDARLCPRCNAWVDAECSETYCTYCTRRPERPIPTE
jgi:uncharacterized CHY-type Zn-finger protein